MSTTISEFAPLELEEAIELKELIGRAAQQDEAVIINRDESGLAGPVSPDLISPSENTNALARFQRHY
jgi:hypothetical protein